MVGDMQRAVRHELHKRVMVNCYLPPWVVNQAVPPPRNLSPVDLAAEAARPRWIDAPPADTG